MSNQAKVTSVEALIAFRANLINYLGQARATAEEMTSDVMRTRLWLQEDRRSHWQGQLSRRAKVYEEARSSLHSAEIANFRTVSFAEQQALRRARAAYEEAQGKLERIKRWTREYDSRIEPVARRMERLHTFLSKDLPEALVHLDKLIATLQNYGETRAELAEAPSSGAASAPTGVETAGTDSGHDAERDSAA